MSEYDIIFFPNDEHDPSASSNFTYQPSDPTYAPAAIGDAQTQAFDSGKCLGQSSMAQTLGTDLLEFDQQLFLSLAGISQLLTQPPSTPPTSLVTEPSAQSWADLFPELFPQPQSFWSIDDQRKWDELIRWEMAQPGYPLYPGRTFGANHLGWNLQATGASHDVLPICSGEHNQSGGPLGSVGYWDPVQQKVTLKGWKYKVSWLYHFISAWLTIVARLLPYSACPHRHPARGLYRIISTPFTKTSTSVCLRRRQRMVDD
jgi:hypothetical protein